LETENTDNKAAHQLNVYKYEGKKRNVVRWYVTNSYENCLKEYVDKENGTSCIKVNYFDLIMALRLSDVMQKVLDDPSNIYPSFNHDNLDEIRQLIINLKSLDGLIKYIAEDSIIRGHSNMKDAFLSRELNFSINGTLFPVITEPCKAYEILLKTDNTEAYERLNSILDNNIKDVDERLRIAVELSQAIPDDYRIWDVLADIYTDKEEFDKAIECCKRALDLLPNDPFLLRNYIITLNKESSASRKPYAFHQSEEEKEAAKVLFNDYWYLDAELPSGYLYDLKINDNECEKPRQ
jgi:tetratricopeptide (TPR) repeat protein